MFYTFQIENMTWYLCPSSYNIKPIVRTFCFVQCFLCILCCVCFLCIVCCGMFYTFQIENMTWYLCPSSYNIKPIVRTFCFVQCVLCIYASMHLYRSLNVTKHNHTHILLGLLVLAIYSAMCSYMQRKVKK